MSTSTSSASGSTRTVAAEVWMRPELSVTGTRCTRWVPPSNLRWLHTVSPRTRKVIWLRPPRSERSVESTSTDHPMRAAYAWYIWNRSRAKRLASSPPSRPPDLDDHVPAVVGVGRDQQELELLLEVVELLLRCVHLFPTQCPLVAAGLGQQLPGRLEVGLTGQVPAVGLHDRREVLEALGSLVQPLVIAEHGRVGQLGLHGLVLPDQVLQSLVHGEQATGRVVREAPSPPRPERRAVRPGGG